MLKKSNVKIILDIFMAVVFLLLMDPFSTGLNLHEITGLVIFAVFIVHKFLNWKFIKNITRGFFKKIPVKARINYILDVFLLSGMLLIIISGILISETILIDIEASDKHLFKYIHSISSYWTLIIVGIHTGLHFKWVINKFRRRKIN